MGPYELESRLGGGGMGEVFLACHAKTGRMVAIKAPRPGTGPENKALSQRFAHECGTLSALDHPGILPIYEVGEERGVPWFAMKLAEGGSLADHLKGPRSPREAAAIVADVAEAVQYAHERGILHRDIKPGNILLDENSHPLLGDFGLARWVETDGVQTPSVLGTPGYAAPEILHGRAPSVAGDVYSLGAVLCHLLTGTPPQDGKLQSTAANPEAGSRTTTTAIPRDLAVACAKCLEPEPQHRYSSAEALAKDLRSWLSGHGVSVRPVTPAERLRRAIVRNPTITGLLLVIALAFTGLLAFGLHSNRQLLAAERTQRQAAEALAAERIRAERLAHADVLMMHGDSGARSGTLKAMREEWMKGPDVELRSKAIRALGLADMSEPHQSSGPATLHLAATIGGNSNEASANTLRAEILAGDGSKVQITGFPNATKQAFELPSKVVTMSWSPDGLSLALATADKKVWAWRTATSTLEHHLGDRESDTARIAWHPLGRHAACIMQDGEIALWDLERGEDVVIHPIGLSPKSPLEWSADGSHLFCQREMGEWLQCEVTLPEGIRLLRLPSPEDRPGNFPTMDISPDGRHVSMSTSAGIRLWDLHDSTGGRQHLAVARATNEWLGARFTRDGMLACGWNTGLRRVDQEAMKHSTMRTAPGTLPYVGSVLMDASADGHWIALLQGPQNRFQVLAASGGARPVSLPQTGPLSISLSSDGSRGATSSYRVREVRFWALPEGKLMRTISTNSAARVAVTTDGSQVAVATDDGVRIYDWGSGVMRLHLKTPGKAHAIAWSGDGRYLAVVASRSCHVFRSSDGELLMSLRSPSLISRSEPVDLIFSKNDHVLAAQLSDGSLMIWDIDRIQNALSALDMGWN
ncbi:MAG TPA: protein kinase [Candidatus Saccharimonadia bacterium]|nr:protein kinase [Candidatus Saccharimonadia bacterium]